MPFVVLSYHQPLKSLDSLATNVNRVQRCYDNLSPCTDKLVYRPGKLNGNADLMSRLPLPATKDALEAKLRLTDPTDIYVYFLGSSAVQTRLRGRAGTFFGGLAMQTGDHFEGGERKHRPAIPITHEQARLSWQLIQRDRKWKQNQTRPPEGPRVYAVPDDSPLTYPDEISVVRGQLEPGLMLHACPMTEEGRQLLGLKSKQDVWQ